MADRTRAEQTWHWLVSGCLVVGVAASLLVVDPAKGLWVVVPPAVAMVTVTLACEPSAARRAARNATVAAATAISLIGWFGLLDFAVPLVGAILVALHPACLRRWARLLDRDVPREGEPAPYEQLTTTALVHTWRLNYWALTTSPDPGVRARAADSRRLCLEELERRDPDGVRRWLAAGAKADGDPSPFLRGVRAPRRSA